MVVKALPRKFTTEPAGSWPLLPKVVIKKNDPKSDLARYAQRACNAMGFTDKNGAKLKVDGAPGPLTMSAIAKMQSAAGITLEKDRIDYWTWVVIDDAMYDTWVAAKLTQNSLCNRCKAIYRGHNRYTGLPVNSYGITRQCQFMSDAGRLAQPYWPINFVAVDRNMVGSSTVMSEHSFGHPRDFMADLDKDGNYKEPAEVAKMQALCDYYFGSMLTGPMQTIVVAHRTSGAMGIDDTSKPLKRKTYRFSGRLRVCKIIYRGYIAEWRYVSGEWVLAWWKLKASSNQHMDHAHIETAPVTDGILYNKAA